MSQVVFTACCAASTWPKKINECCFKKRIKVLQILFSFSTVSGVYCIYCASELLVRLSNSFGNCLPRHLSDVGLEAPCPIIFVIFQNRRFDSHTHFTHTPAVQRWEMSQSLNLSMSVFLFLTQHLLSRVKSRVIISIVMNAALNLSCCSFSRPHFRRSARWKSLQETFCAYITFKTRMSYQESLLFWQKCIKSELTSLLSLLHSWQIVFHRKMSSVLAVFLQHFAMGILQETMRKSWEL